MGFFSWKTADTEETIPASSSAVGPRPVYLLQPNGLPPIFEPNYEGYGSFGGVDAYEWLARTNLPEMCDGRSVEFIQELGLAIDMGDYYADINDGSLWGYHYVDNIGKDFGIQRMEGNYGTVQPKYGKTPNDLIREGTWERRPYSAILGGLKYPIKLSFYRDAVYENLTASKDCPNQGFFYSEEEVREILSNIAKFGTTDKSLYLSNQTSTGSTVFKKR